MLAAKGIGPSLALSLLSTLSSERLVRAIRERDVPTLRSVPRVGKKKAEQLVLDLADKLEALFEPPDQRPRARLRRQSTRRFSVSCALATPAATRSAPSGRWSTAAVCAPPQR